MDLLIVPVPLFNTGIAVEAYYFRLQKGNDIIQSSRTTGVLDGAMNSPALETLNLVGLEAFTMGKPVFVPIDNFMLLANLENQCTQPADKIIFLLDGDIRVEDDTIAAIARLKGLGYRFAIQKIANAEVYGPVLALCDYIYLDHRLFDQAEQLRLRFDILKNYRHLNVVLTHIGTMEMFLSLKDKFKGIYEGRFYRMPLTKGSHGVSPLQANLINLLNTVRDENFEFGDVTEIVQRDTALTISLLRLVNSPYIGLRQEVKSIGQAVALLGQKEVTKWVTTAVTRLLGTEKPSEITRLSLIRAKFAEALAPRFGLKREAGSLFLMGLFSVLDAILEMPMEQALEQVRVSDTIRQALVERDGPFETAYEFLLEYEAANWNVVSRTLILRDLSAEDVYSAYTEALCWYRDLLEDSTK
jgi:EAL and modified HD-GYP domain-containing signal transduction protein